MRIYDLLRSAIVAAVCLSPMSAAHGAELPAPILGKSLELTWSETWIAHDALSDAWKNIPVSSRVKVYISTQRRIFSSVERIAGRRKGQVEKTFNQVSGEGNGLLHWQYEGGELVADQRFSQGARRLSVHLNDDFNGCSLKIIIGKAAGTSTIQSNSMSGLYKWDDVKITVNSADCRVSEGNILAN